MFLALLLETESVFVCLEPLVVVNSAGLATAPDVGRGKVLFSFGSVPVDSFCGLVSPAQVGWAVEMVVWGVISGG